MSPSECKDKYDVLNYLNEQGVAYNNYSMTVIPTFVLIEGSDFQVKIPQHIFKRFSEWYLEDQEINNHE